MAKEMDMGKAIATSSHGNAVLLVQQLLGNSVERTVVRTSVLMVVVHPRGLLVAVGITMVAMDRVVGMVDLQAVEQLLGNDRTTTLLHLHHLVVSTAMVDTLVATEIRPVDMVDSRLWALLLVLAVALAALVLHLVWVLCSRTTVRMELQVVLHLHHLRMIFLPR